MNLAVHVASGGVFTVLFFKLLGIKGAIGFFCFASFLDIDHYLYYLIKFRNWNIGKASEYFHSNKHVERFCLCIFHTVEFFTLFALVAYVSHSTFFIAIFFGILLHFLIDIAQGLYYKRMHYRWWSVMDYYRSMIKKQEAG